MVMKKYSFIAMLAIAAMAAFSCAKEADLPEEINQEPVEEVIPTVDNPLVITAYADDDIAPDTKTSLSGVSVRWSGSDAVAAYTSGDENPHLSTDTAISDGGKKATFTFSDLTVGTDVTYLIYPASAAGVEDTGLYEITLPTEQAATEDSFADGANLSLADGSVSADAVQFKNLGALIGIKINNDNIESVKIAADEFMTGAGYADPSDYSVVAGGEKYVKLTGGLDNGEQYYAVVYPSPAEGYSSLQIVAENTLGQTATYSNPNKLILERNDNKLIANLTIADSKWYPALNTWTYSFTSQVYSATGDQTLNGKTWTLAGTGSTPGYGYTAAKGQQFGTQSKPFSNFTLTSNFGAGEGIKSVLVRASGANDIEGTLSVSVGGTAYKCSSATSVDLTSSATDYVFATPDGKVKTGNIVISMAQTSSKGMYIKTITVNGKDAAELSFANAEYDLELESSAYASFSGQVVNNPHSLSVSYESDDTTIATVASDGTVTLQGKAGTATITATSTETSTYLAGAASYEINVTAIQTLPYSIMLLSGGYGKFTFDADGWSHSDSYGMVAQGSSTGEDYWLISPVIDMRAEEAGCLNFYHTANGVGALSTDCTVWARRVGGDWSQLTIPSMPSNDNWTYVSSGKIALNSYAGYKMQVGFKYHSTNTSGKWEIKNLTMTTEDITRTAATLAFANASMELTTLSDDTANVASTNSDASVTYSSDDEGVVTISAAGVVSVVAAGSTTIRAHVDQTASYTSADAECTVTVSKVKLTTPTASAAKSGDDAIVVSWTENDARVASYTVTCTDQSNRSIDAGGAASTTFSSLSDGSYTVTVVAVPTDTDTYASSDAWTSSSIAIGTPSPSAIYTANFEGDSEHRTSGSNSYTSNSYTVSGVTWSLTKADCVTTGSPLAGSANIMCRVKGSANNGSVTTDNVLSASKTIKKVTFLSKLGTNVTMTLKYSTNGTSWTTLTYAKDTDVDETNGYSATVSDVVTSDFRLKWEYVTSDASNKTTSRDSQLDNVIVYGEQLAFIFHLIRGPGTEPRIFIVDKRGL